MNKAIFMLFQGHKGNAYYPRRSAVTRAERRDSSTTGGALPSNPL